MKILELIGLKKPEVLTVDKEAVTNYVNTKNYPKEVLEIHHEFEVAADKLLNEAYSIINTQPKVNESKLERLAKFGFKQAKEVSEGSKILEVTKLSREQIDLVNYYKQNYPFNKFINEEQVKTICHKYNLVCGDVDRFRGFVPDDNLKQIESFKLKDEDKGLIINILDSRMREISETLFLSQAVIKYSGSYGHIYKEGNDKDYAFQCDRATRGFYASDSKDLFGLAYKGDIRFNTDNTTFKICAPVKDMDISGLELKEGYKLERKIEIPDPVVLQPVKGGYLIITAWGDEASDPLVVNEINN